MPTATLRGHWAVPFFELRFGYQDQTPGGILLREWVKRLADRRWVPETKSWIMFAFAGHDPLKVLDRAGFDVDLDRFVWPTELDRPDSLIEGLSEPVVRRWKTTPGKFLVFPRFTGQEKTERLLRGHGSWDANKRWFVASAVDLVDNKGIALPHLSFGKKTVEDVVSRAEAVRKADLSHARSVTKIATTSKGAEDPEAAAEISRVVAEVGDIPDDFELTPFPYQRLGALAAMTGRTLIADSPGLGKTYTALATAAIKKWKRILLVVPPVVLTHWAGKVAEAGMAQPLPKRTMTEDVDYPAISIHRAGRKFWGWPDRGVVLVVDSILTPNSGGMMSAAIDWGADTLIYDESHRAMTPDSKRAQAMRKLAANIREGGGTVLCLSGTPSPSGNPAELVAQLDMTGHLDPVFGGENDFLYRYCWKDDYKRWRPRKSRLDELNGKLTDYVFVRRHKHEVLTDLPQCMVSPVTVDVDLRGYREAHEQVLVTIGEWIDEFRAEHDRLPEAEEVQEWAKGQLGVVTPMRVAAGVAKIASAKDLVTEWVESEDAPLLVWAHHHEVLDGLAEAVGQSLPKGQWQMLSGRSSSTAVDQAVADFQAGNLRVLICGITAVNVGVTLTRGSDQLFVESDWRPDVMEQALGRQDRIGQNSDRVSARVMIASDTLDDKIQQVLATKSQHVEQGLGGNGFVFNYRPPKDASTSIAEVVARIAEVALAKRRS